jgi:hypothetical protein
MGMFGPYVYINKKKEKYYLHMRGRGRRILYYFSKDPNGALPEIPPGFEVFENEKSGLPMLRKKTTPGIMGLLVGGFEPKKEEKKMEY